MHTEYAEAVKGKSGFGMAEVLFASFGGDYSCVERIDSPIPSNPARQVSRTTSYIGLNMRHKVLAVCGDNAANNDTFCDHFHQMLQEDDTHTNYRFKGRESRIRCLAHILALVSKAVYVYLKAESREDAEQVVNRAVENGGQFSDLCTSLSIYMKIRALVLWIMKGGDRLDSWESICEVHIPLDVDTRWNTLYLMMLIARRHRSKISQFVRLNPECRHLLPTDEEWRICEQVERCMEPFYNHTLSVSRQVPSLPEYLPIMWGLNDLIEEVTTGGEPYGDICEDLRRAFGFAKAKLDIYTEKTHESTIIFAAHVLDPRFKFTLIREQYGDEADQIIERVKSFFKREYPRTSLPPVQEQPTERPPGMAIHHWQMLQRANRLNRSTSSNLTSQQMDDFDRYLYDDPISIASDPVQEGEEWLLNWWKLHGARYPDVATACRDIFAIPSAEVDVERLFSGGRDQIGIRRSAQDAQTMRLSRLLKSHWDQEDKRQRTLAQKQLQTYQQHHGVSHK